MPAVGYPLRAVKLALFALQSVFTTMLEVCPLMIREQVYDLSHSQEGASNDFDRLC